jgi:hypothetical protein
LSTRLDVGRRAGAVDSPRGGNREPKKRFVAANGSIKNVPVDFAKADCLLPADV